MTDAPGFVPDVAPEGRRIRTTLPDPHRPEVEDIPLGVEKETDSSKPGRPTEYWSTTEDSPTDEINELSP